MLANMTLTPRTLILTMAVFALQPIAFGGWLALIPLVKEQLGLNKAELAVALLGLPVATVISLQVASRLIPKIGPRKILAVMFPVQAPVLLLPLFARSQSELFLALTGFGVVMAFMQVCLNVYAGRLEKETGAHIMNRCHGFWAIGLMVGSLAIAALLWAGPVAALFALGITTGIMGVFCALALPQLAAEAIKTNPPRRSIAEMPRMLFLISLVTFAVSMTEGAMADWGAVYMAERLPIGSSYIGIGVSIYAGALAFGRLLGDTLKTRFGAMRLARMTFATALTGVLLLVLPLPLYVALFGFACVGIGASVGFPLGVSAAASLDDGYESANIAVMSSIGISGFLLGPPMIGFLAEAFTLRIGLAALIPGLVIAAVFARCLETRKTG